MNSYDDLIVKHYNLIAKNYTFSLKGTYSILLQLIKYNILEISLSKKYLEISLTIFYLFLCVYIDRHSLSLYV